MADEHRAWHFGVLSFTGTGHVIPLIALSQELKARGHRVTFFEKPKIADRVRHAGLDFVSLEGDNYLPKATPPPAVNQGVWSDISMLRFNLKRVTNDIEMFLRTAPLTLRSSGVDAIIINEVALIGPTVAELLHLPRKAIPANFHYTGPFVSESARRQVDFPWHRLDGRPVIYASLGTTRNVQPLVFGMIAEACRGLDAQLVISLGGRFRPEQFGPFPGDPLVVRYAPQLDLLKVADVVITHSGSNTVFETLMQGVPMVAIPIAHDQPAIAARLARLELAQVVPPRDLSAQKIRSAIVTVLSETRYRDSAQKIATQMCSLQGAKHAADIMETTLAKCASSPHANANPRRSPTYAIMSS